MRCDRTELEILAQISSAPPDAMAVADEAHGEAMIVADLHSGKVMSMG